MVKFMKKPITISVTGAAGRVCYNLLFRIASGEMLGIDQPIVLQLLEIKPAIKQLIEIISELKECAFPIITEIIYSDDPFIAFANADIAILAASETRQEWMRERKYLLEGNASIAALHGKALVKSAKKNVKVLTIANPANTYALIVLQNAQGMVAQNFTSLICLDHNRAISQLATKTEHHPSDIKKVIIWGNHSVLQHPDISHTEIAGIKATNILEKSWVENHFIPTVQNRGFALVDIYNGLSAAASTAQAIIKHMQTWIFGSNDADDWISMGVLSDGSYDIPPGIFYGFPVTCKDGKYKIVQGLTISPSSQARMMNSYYELIKERAQIEHLL